MTEPTEPTTTPETIQAAAFAQAHHLGEDINPDDIANEADWGTLNGKRNPEVAD